METHDVLADDVHPLGPGARTRDLGVREAEGRDVVGEGSSQT